MENLKHIKNRVVAFEKNGRTVIYLKGRYKPYTLYNWQRRLRIRSALFGHNFTTYHSGMDFTLALASGWMPVDC